MQHTNKQLHEKKLARALSCLLEEIGIYLPRGEREGWRGMHLEELPPSESRQVQE
jgi:hypothetical protein